jgi:hypothetical protein
MPKPEQLPAELQTLARRQAYELSDRRWEFDVNQLVESLESIVGPRIKKDLTSTPWWKQKKKDRMGGRCRSHRNFREPL